MRIPKLVTLIAPVAVVLTFSPAYAEHGGRPCRNDIQALCPDITPGPGAFRDCLSALCPNITPGNGAFLSCLQLYSDKLSPGCQDHLSKIQARITAWQEACQADAQTLCPDTTPSHGNIIRCLRQNQDQLSSACAAVFQQHGNHRRHHRHDALPPTPTE